METWLKHGIYGLKHGKYKGNGLSKGKLDCCFPNKKSIGKVGGVKYSLEAVSHFLFELP